MSKPFGNSLTVKELFEPKKGEDSGALRVIQALTIDAPEESSGIRHVETLRELRLFEVVDPNGHPFFYDTKRGVMCKPVCLNPSTLRDIQSRLRQAGAPELKEKNKRKK